MVARWHLGGFIKANTQQSSLNFYEFVYICIFHTYSRWQLQQKKLCLADDNIDSQQLHYQKKNKGVGVKCVNDKFSRERANETTFMSHKKI
jgi:hypothetical protein